MGKEGEDLSRHDKWLCMMYPRLKLLQKLLSEDGVIFISIDDTGFSYLRLIIEEVCQRLLSEGRMWFSADGNGVPRRKTYLSEREGRGIWTWWTNSEVGYTQIATQELAAILGKAVFDYPKPVRLIERILKIASDPDSIILDSFAGSGTTAHAVLNMNKADGDNRKFILIEMMDYADSITAERVKRVIDGYKTDRETVLYNEEITEKNLAQGADMLEEAKAIAKEAKEKYSSVKKPKVETGHLRVVAVDKAKDMVAGTGGDFSYYELGEPLLFSDGNLNEAVGV